MSTSPERGTLVSIQRPRGRPLSMSRQALIGKIQKLAERPGGLYRVHLTHPQIYARARRQYGSWAAAIAAAGYDYEAIIDRARERSLVTRRRKGRRPARRTA